MIAAFDADGTIWREDSFNCFVSWLCAHKYPSLSLRFSDYLELEKSDPDYAYTFAPTLFRGLPMDSLKEQAQVFADSRPMSIINATVEKIIESRTQGKKIIVVSATASFILRPLLDELPIDNIMGLELELDSKQQITGKILGVPTINKGKAQAISKTYPQQEVSLCMGNSYLDFPMLKLAKDEKLAINPDRKLLDVAREKNWKVLFK